MKNWEKYRTELARMLAEDPEADYYLGWQACYLSEVEGCDGCPFMPSEGSSKECLLSQEWLNEEAK